MDQIRRSPIRLACVAFILALFPQSDALAQVGPATTAKPEAAQGNTATQINTSIRIRWTGLNGIKRYRLQVAHDAEFKDIVFDRLVYGNEYVVTGLPPGSYFWHAAPAASETGRYSKPVAVNVNESPASTATPTGPPVMTANASIGWRTTTGDVRQPLAARLRPGTGYDFVGVNSDGMVYALDGSLGFAMWTARFRPQALRGEQTGNGGAPAFTPVLINGKNGTQNVVVAFAGGVRALEGATGRELWRAALKDSPASGVLLSSAEGGNPGSLIIVSNSQPSLTVLNPETGQVLSSSKLDAAVVGAPVTFATKDERGVVLGLEGGVLEMRSGNGERLRMIKMDTEITTPPLLVDNAELGTVVLVGTNSGLIALRAAELKPTGRIATEEDAPRGTLVAADMDNDGSAEVVMVTRRGRVVVISTASGKIKWYTNGATDAAAATFADLNNDSVLDVIVAAGTTFALGFSGKDGSLIWRAEEEVKGAAQNPDASTQLRTLVAAPSGSNAQAMVVGSDSTRVGLRAVGLPGGSIKSAQR